MSWPLLKLRSILNVFWLECSTKHVVQVISSLQSRGSPGKWQGDHKWKGGKCENNFEKICLQLKVMRVEVIKKESI